jgi:hypothetical protein
MQLLRSLAIVVLMCAPAFAQWAKVPAATIPRTADGKPNLSAPAPRLPDGKPDLSGIWNPPTGYLRNLARDLKEDVPFQPWAKTLYDERAAGVHWKDEPDANCLPQGVPKVLLAPAPWRIVQTPAIVFFVHEAFNLWWQAFMDGREFVPHPDVTPTCFDRGAARHDAFPSQGFRPHGYRRDHRRPEGLHAPVGDDGRSDAHPRDPADGVHLPGERKGYAKEVGHEAPAGP